MSHQFNATIITTTKIKHIKSVDNIGTIGDNRNKNVRLAIDNFSPIQRSFQYSETALANYTWHTHDFM